MFKIFLRAIFSISLTFTSAAAIFAQTEAMPAIQPSCEVSLHLIVGSNEAAKKGDIPENLNAIIKKLRSTFPFTNYRLANTLLGRISNDGSFEYKSVGDAFGQGSAGASQTFLEWSMNNFRTGPTAKGTPGFQAQGFRFGARVPVTVGTREENGKMIPSISYESIGLVLGKIGFAQTFPTLIGTIDMPGADGTIFLVMTVRSADL